MAFEVGQIVEGKVTGIMNYGAFVDLGDNTSGMVHISEVAPVYVREIKDHLAVGQSVKVKILGIDEKGKISLSIKALLKNSEPEKEAAPEEAAEETVPTAEDAPETLEVPTEIAEAVEEAPAAEEVAEAAEEAKEDAE